MNTELEELTRRISKLSDDELVKMLAVDHESYREEALEIARREFSARNLGTLEERAHELRTRPPEPPEFVDVSRCPTRPGSTWPGFVIGGCVLILEAARSLVNVHAQRSVQIVIVVFAICGLLLWLARVDRLHGVLRRETRGTYPIRTPNVLLSQLHPIFNLYWVFRWTNEVVRFVNSRGPARRMWIGWAGVLLFIAFLPGSLDSAIRLFLAFGTLAYLSRRVESVSNPDAPPVLDPGWGSAASTS